MSRTTSPDPCFDCPVAEQDQNCPTSSSTVIQMEESPKIISNVPSEPMALKGENQQSVNTTTTTTVIIENGDGVEERDHDDESSHFLSKLSWCDQFSFWLAWIVALCGLGLGIGAAILIQEAYDREREDKRNSFPLGEVLGLFASMTAAFLHLFGVIIALCSWGCCTGGTSKCFGCLNVVNYLTCLVSTILGVFLLLGASSGPLVVGVSTAALFVLAIPSSIRLQIVALNCGCCCGKSQQ